MMNEEKIRRGSRKLSWLLRHGANEARLDMDAAGWVSVTEVLEHLHLDRATLEQIVARNDKRRIELTETRLRACQGHSLDGMPVSQAALEASWRVYAGGPTIWHGTGLVALDGIAERGIEPSARTHVHLAEAVDSVVGKRAKVQVMLAVSIARMAAANQAIWQASNGVVLTRRVPPECIEGAKPMSRKARARAKAEDGPFPWL